MTYIHDCTQIVSELEKGNCVYLSSFTGKFETWTDVVDYISEIYSDPRLCLLTSPYDKGGILLSKLKEKHGSGRVSAATPEYFDNLALSRNLPENFFSFLATPFAFYFSDNILGIVSDKYRHDNIEETLKEIRMLLIRNLFNRFSKFLIHN